MKVSLALMWLHNSDQLSALWKRDEATCRKYAALDTPFPAVKIEEPLFPWHISDGRHRVIAASLRGDFEIEAIVTPLLFHPEE